MIFSYLGEFLSVKHRDKYLGKLEIFWNIGIIILPGKQWNKVSFYYPNYLILSCITNYEFIQNNKNITAMLFYAINFLLIKCTDEIILC